MSLISCVLQFDDWKTETLKEIHMQVLTRTLTWQAPQEQQKETVLALQRLQDLPRDAWSTLIGEPTTASCSGKSNPCCCSLGSKSCC